MTPEKLDKIVCDWSMKFGIALTEEALNALVDELAVVAREKPVEATPAQH